jgi:AraC-like DNA-binding protein
MKDFAALCCEEPHLELLSDPNSVSFHRWVGVVGPITVVALAVEADVVLDCGEQCSGYRMNVLRSGYLESVHRGRSLTAASGAVAVYQPEGHAAARWAAGSRMLAVKIDRYALEEALGDAIGRQIPSQIDFAPLLLTATAPARSWVDMLLMLCKQACRPDSLIHQPFVGLPFADSLVRGFLVAADHPYRGAVTTGRPEAPPDAIRTAIEIVEEEAHLPTTVTELAARTHVSVRALQQGFHRHLGVSPMTYLRGVRLSRAHQMLLESDPSSSTVASVARRWGFSNLGRFAAAHADRYGEAPSETFHRKVSRRSNASNNQINTRRV